MSEVLPEQFVGQEIGSYHVDQLLGQGKVNALYQARHTAQDQAVMLTVFLIPKTFSAQARSQFLARFRREGSSLLKLFHPHIFPLYDMGEHLGLPYLVNPLHKGTSLSKKLRAEGRLTTKQALNVLRPIADALDLAHSSAVFHGSLSSSNILFTEDEVVMVAGFGVAHILVMRGIDQLENPPHAHLLNIAGTFLSPPAYLSPEVVQGAPIDRRTDTYALGILLFELLSGAPPFTGAHPADILQQLFRQPIPSLSAQVPPISPDVDAVIQKALHRQPDQRFQSAGELVHAFILATQPAQRPSVDIQLSTTQKTGPTPTSKRQPAPQSTNPSLARLPAPPAAQNTNIPLAQTLKDAKLPPIQTNQPAAFNLQNTLPLTVNWLDTNKPDQPDALPDPSEQASSSTPPDAFFNQLNTNSLPGIDPFDWWHSTAQTSVPAPANKDASRRSVRNTSTKKGKKPQKQSRRRVIALFATGGVMILGAAGISGLLLPRLLQKKTPPPRAASTQPSPQSQTMLQPQPASTPTPKPKPKPTATPNPTPTPVPPPPPQHTGTVIASTGMAANSARNFTDPASGKDSVLVHLASGNFVAFDRACTHEQVAVDYDPGSRQLVCPAHDARFDPANAASVTNGPADTPLPRIAIRVNPDGTITAG